MIQWAFFFHLLLGGVLPPPERTESLSSRIIIGNSMLYSLTWVASLDYTIRIICLEFGDKIMNIWP